MATLRPHPLKPVVLLLLAALGACGGGGPASPTGAGSPTSTVVAVVSGDTGASVSGASASIDGRAAVTDGTGRATVAVMSGSTITIDARGFFLRETLWRGEPVLQLWPIRSDAGEAFISELVYNQLVSDGSVTRPVSGISLVLSPALRADPVARAAQEAAASRVTDATDGAIPFLVSDAAPASGVAVNILVDPADAFLVSNPAYGAITRVTFPGNRIASGSITYRGLREAAASSLATHEMGHLLGLGHPSQRGLMSPATIAEFSNFTRAELFGVHMMQLRLPGNRPPDNDRGAKASSAHRSSEVGCPWEP